MSDFSRENLSRIYNNIGFDPLGFIRLILNDQCGLSEGFLTRLTDPFSGILSCFPLDVESNFQRIVAAKIAMEFEGLPEHRIAVRQWRNCKAIRYIERYGDTSLLDALHDEDWVRFAPAERKPDPMDPFQSIEELFKAVDDPLYDSEGLLLPFRLNSEERSILPCFRFDPLPPRGTAVLMLQTMYSVESALSNPMLNSKVSRSFTLPSPDSYEYLLWKYSVKAGLLSEDDIKVADSVLLPEVHDFFGIRPESPQIQQNVDWPPKRFNFSKKYYQYRDDLEDQYSIYLDGIEEEFQNTLANNVNEVADIIENNTMGCFVAMLSCDRPQLFKELSREAGQHITALVKSQGDNIQFKRRISQFNNILDDDPVFYSVFYNYLYDLKKMLNFRWDPGWRKPGRPPKQGKKAVRAILCPLIQKLKDNNVEYPWDTAAELINLMIGYEMYESGSNEGFDTKTRGGASLRSEYRRWCNSL